MKRLACCLAAQIAISLATLPIVPDSLAAGNSYAMNQKTVGVIAGEPEWLPLVQDVAKSLNHWDGLRVLPIAGDGAIQSVSDLIHISGVDVALVPADSVAYAKAQNLLPPNEEKIAYLARMGTIKVLLVTRKGITNITALANKRIATGPAQSAGFATGELVFGAAGINFKRVAADGAAAIAALDSGKADAALVLGAQNLATLKSPEQFHVLPLSLPKQLETTYAPSLLSRQELSRYKMQGNAIDTIATPLVLAVFNWKEKNPHSEALYTFNKAMLEASTLPDNAAPWIRNNLAADVPGLLRHQSSVRAFGEHPRVKMPNTQETTGDNP
jgi:TRAP-type uncharacterized transport system substrate-binding protein